MEAISPKEASAIGDALKKRRLGVKTNYYPSVSTIQKCDQLLRVLEQKAYRRRKGKSLTTYLKQSHYDRIMELKKIRENLEKSIKETEALKQDQ